MSTTLKQKTYTDNDGVEHAYTGELRYMGPDGDTAVRWDSTDEAQVSAARAMFDDLRRRGFMAYSVEAGGRRGEVVRDFDPKAERIILAPQMAGGCR